MGKIASLLEPFTGPRATDPLSDVSRRERRTLLTACTISLAISLGGLVPEKIDAFGITVNTTQAQNLYYLMAAVLLYLVIAFWVYSWADLKSREIEIKKAQALIQPEIDQIQTDLKAFKVDASNVMTVMQDPRFREHMRRVDEMKLAKLAMRAYRFRRILDVELPIVIGASSIGFVLWKSGGFPGWKWTVVVSFIVAIILLCILSWISRGRISKSLKKIYARLLRHRGNRMLKKATKLDKASAKKEKMLSDAHKLLMKSIEVEFSPLSNTQVKSK